jgi:multicomponent Na+:H+ antiporter subunit G
MSAWVTAGLLVLGSSLMLLAGVAIVRFPDLYARMQAATKASTLGMTCTMLAVGVHFASFTVGMRAVGVIVFFFLTAPVAAHMIGRAAYRVGVPLWEGTWLNEMPPPDRIVADADTTTAVSERTPGPP